MKNRLAETIIIIIAVVLIGVAAMYNYNDRAKCTKALETERLKQDSLMAVKQLLDKEIFLLKKNFDSLKKQSEKAETLSAATSHKKKQTVKKQ